MDTLFILVILMNMGAVALTNVMVVHDNTVEVELGIADELEYKELNPAQANLNNYESSPQETEVFNALIKQFLIFWVPITWIYTYFRRNMITEHDLTLLKFAVIFYFVLLGYDFANDLGYFIGELWFR